MKTKEVLELACVFLGKEELLGSQYFSNNEHYELTDSEQKELNILNRCLTLITNEISTDYLFINATKKVIANAGEISLEDIDSSVYEIIKITDLYKKPLKFKLYNNKVYVDASEVIVKYRKYAMRPNLDGECEGFSNRISARVLAYGVAMEYSFISSLYDDATIWENRYKNALLVLARNKANMVMPAKEWK